MAFRIRRENEGPPTVSYFPGVGLTVTSILPRSVAAMAQPTGEKGPFLVRGKGPRQKGSSNSNGVKKGEKGERGHHYTLTARLQCRSRLEGERGVVFSVAPRQKWRAEFD